MRVLASRWVRTGGLQFLRFCRRWIWANPGDQLVSISYKLPLRLIPASLLLVAFDAVLLTQHRQLDDQPLPLPQQQ